eukprot:Nitzschia sp. Nitz4//scaffold62_size106224//84775//86172//NITZ4_004368-RA/size106224-processed-gene-0.58-mRNA-1//-1//CDS//3329555892//8819//frame0
MRGREEERHTIDISEIRRTEVLNTAKRLLGRGGTTIDKNETLECNQSLDSRKDTLNDSREVVDLDCRVRDGESSRIHQLRAKRTFLVSKEFQAKVQEVRDLTNSLKEQDREAASLRATVSKLQEELKHLQAKKATDQSHFAKRAEATHRELEKLLREKDQKLDFYEVSLDMKEKELKRMTDDMSELRRRKTECEVQLEVNDCQFALLEKSSTLQFHRTHDTTEEADNSALLSANQQLQAELTKMEEKYKGAVLEGTQKSASLQDQCTRHRTRILELERTIAVLKEEFKYPDSLPCVPVHAAPAPKSDGSEDDVPSDLPLSFFKKRIQLLERENANYGQVALSLKWKLERMQEAMAKRERDTSREISTLRNRNVALEAKMSILETDQDPTIGNSDKDSRYEVFEKILDDSISEITRLQERLRIKNRIIASLRSRVVDQRLEKVSTTSEKQGQQTIDALLEPSSPQK